MAVSRKNMLEWRSTEVLIIPVILVFTICYTCVQVFTVTLKGLQWQMRKSLGMTDLGIEPRLPVRLVPA